jgi:hypothetical protein
MTGRDLSITMKLSLLSVLAALSLSSIACGGSQHGMHYQLLIDSSLSASEAESVMAAGAAWETAVPGLSFDYVVADCAGNAWPHTICVLWDNGSPPAANVLATTKWDTSTFAPTSSQDSATVHLWSATRSFDDGAADRFLNVVCHELGHGLTHDSSHLSEGHLMQPETASGKVLEITPGDVDFFWSAR